MQVIPAPYSLRGSAFLSRNPQARAEDIMWAFENKKIKAIIANMGGNDSIRIIPHIDTKCIRENPKILIGFSDVMNLHLLCFQCGLGSFYGDNLLYPVGDPQGWHPYSKRWFQKALFQTDPLGKIPPAEEWTPEKPDYTNEASSRRYYPNTGYELIQGKGIARGFLWGGHTGMMDLADTKIAVSSSQMDGAILFLEDIPSCFSPQHLQNFLHWLADLGGLGKINGIVIGKIQGQGSFSDHIAVLRHTLAFYGRCDLPVLYGVNFGHTSPICILPYGALAQINCDENSFSILESSVV